MIKKDIKEYAILQKIYPGSKFKNIVKRENPDFEIKHNTGYKFGVEITELYFSETNARVMNIPGYFDNIFSNRNYIHKDDIEKLKIGKLTVVSEGKPNREIEGNIQDLPTKDELINMVTEIIINKCNKYDNYDRQLGHINLIIYDMENRYHSIQRKDFFLCFFNEKLVSSIKNSPFREIFFVTELSNNKQYYFPLRLIFLISEIYLVNGFLINNKQYSLPFTNDKYEIIIYSFFLGQEIVTASLIESDSGIELTYSNYGIRIDDKTNSPILIDYADYPLPNIKPIAEDRIRQVDKAIISQYMLFKEN
jgi:hypothetical protein